MYYFFLIIDFIALIVLAVCLFIINEQQTGQSQKLMNSLCTWCLFITFGFCVKISGTELATQLLGQKIVYMGILHVLYFMLLFVMTFCNISIKRPLEIILFVNNFIMSLFALFIGNHTFFYTSVWLEDYNGVPVLRRSYGPLHTLYYVEISIYIAVMLLFLARKTARSNRHAQKTSILLCLTLLIPFGGSLIQKGFVFPYDFLPGCFILVVMIMMELIYVERIYNVTDIAKDYIFETLPLAYIFTDSDYRYKGCNKLARLIFPELNGVNEDESMYSVSPSFRQIINGSLTDISYEGRRYEPSIRRITAGNTIAGIIISLDDVTLKYECEAKENSYLEEMETEIEKQTRYAEQRQKKVEEMSVQLVQTLANAIDAKDKYTNGHSSRVAEYCVRVATAMGMSKEEVDLLRYEGLLHDIGKIGISDNILNKSEGLTDTEFTVLKEHVTIGGDIMHDASTLPGAENVIRHHHERYDGKGYPSGLKGEQIPRDARIVTIVDTYDAMSSNRVYRKALPKDVIKKELLKERGKQFDPEILDVFIRLFDRGTLDDIAPKDNGWFDNLKSASDLNKKANGRMRNRRTPV